MMFISGFGVKLHDNDKSRTFVSSLGTIMIMIVVSSVFYVNQC